jgi:hypothetical protein
MYRRRTPDQRTVDEHPLLIKDLELVRTRFAHVDESFHLLGLLALPLVGRSHFEEVLRSLDAIDRVVFRTSLRRYAWMIGLRVSRPRR